jgi:hypothetical protein
VLLSAPLSSMEKAFINIKYLAISRDAPEFGAEFGGRLVFGKSVKFSTGRFLQPKFGQLALADTSTS